MWGPQGHGDVALRRGCKPSWHVVHGEATTVWHCGMTGQGVWHAIYPAKFEIKKERNNKEKNTYPCCRAGGCDEVTRVPVKTIFVVFFRVLVWFRLVSRERGKK